jgi:hypothetical protein
MRRMRKVPTMMPITMSENSKPFPFGAKITPDPDAKQRLMDSVNEHCSKPRPKIHVSDLVLCPRQSVFRKIMPKPNTERELFYLVPGGTP